MNYQSSNNIQQQLIRRDSELEMGLNQDKNQVNKKQSKKKKGCCQSFCCCFGQSDSDEESENEKKLRIQNQQLKSELLQLKNRVQKQEIQSKQIQTDYIKKTDQGTMMQLITLKIQKISDFIIQNSTKKNNHSFDIELQIMQQSYLLAKNIEQNQQNQSINQQSLLMPQYYQQNSQHQQTQVGDQDLIQIYTNKSKNQGDNQFQSLSQTSQSSNPPSGIYNQIQNGSYSNDQSQQKSNKIKIISQQNNNQYQFLSNSQPQSNIYYNQQIDYQQIYQPQNITSILSQNSYQNSQPVSLINSQNYNNYNQEVYQQQQQYNAVAQNSDQKIDSQFPKKQEEYQIPQILQFQKSSLENSQRDSLDVFQTQVFSSNCYYCQNAIYEYSIQTKCQHNYHVKCFAEMIQSQVFSSKLPYIKCLCQYKLSLNMLSQIDLQEQELTKQQIFQNQLQQICLNIQQRNISIQYCENNCNFFYISQRGQSSICLNCTNNFRLQIY